jgi:hypothetical protein
MKTRRTRAKSLVFSHLLYHKTGKKSRLFVYAKLGYNKAGGVPDE